MPTYTGTLYDLQAHLFYSRVVSTAFGGQIHERGRISAFSERSASRMRRYLRCCTSEYKTLITLTYPCAYPMDGRVVKQHLLRFFRRYRTGAASGRFAEFSVFWFLEFQARGAPHVHAFCTHDLPKGHVARMWYETVGSDDARHLHAGTRIERLRSGRWGTSAYASKYAAKMEQKEVPAEFLNVGRFWGVMGNRTCVAAYTFVKVSDEGKTLEEGMKSDLREVLKAHPGEWKATKHSIFVKFALYLKTERLKLAVSALLLRWGLRIWRVGEGCFGHPLTEIDADPLGGNDG